jgi:hypothetical protein
MAYQYNPHPTIKSFLVKSDIKAHDLEHKRKLNFNINKYLEVVAKGKLQFTNLDLTRQKAKATLQHVVVKYCGLKMPMRLCNKYSLYAKV